MISLTSVCSHNPNGELGESFPATASGVDEAHMLCSALARSGREIRLVSSQGVLLKHWNESTEQRVNESSKENAGFKYVHVDHGTPQGTVWRLSDDADGAVMRIRAPAREGLLGDLRRHRPRATDRRGAARRRAHRHRRHRGCSQGIAMRATADAAPPGGRTRAPRAGQEHRDPRSKSGHESGGHTRRRGASRRGLAPARPGRRTLPPCRE
jgi:hypothetical protein